MSSHELPDEVSELLSALLDGALTDAERADAQEWLDRSAAARAEYDALGRVKSGLRELPAVDPPAGFFDRMLQHPRPDAGGASWWSSPAALVASGIATAAAWAFLGGAGGTDRLVPPIDDVQAAVVADLPVEGSVDVALDTESVTVVRYDGDLDWSSLPPGTRSSIEGAEVWVATGHGPATVVAERDGAVYTLVSEELPASEIVALVEDLPGAGSDSLRTRARNACETLVDAFTWD